MMAGMLENFPSWFRKMCVINFFVLKFSLAVTLLCEMRTVFVTLFVAAVLFYVLHLVACVFICLVASGHALFFFLANNVSVDFAFFLFIMRLGWEQSLQDCLFLILTNLPFCWLTLSSFPCFRWPVLHMGAEQLRSAGLGQRMSLPSQSTASQVSRWDPFGSGCCRWSPQFCPFSLRSCVWLGEEQLRTAGTKWWTRYENSAPRWEKDRLLCLVSPVALAVHISGSITLSSSSWGEMAEKVSVSTGFSCLVEAETCFLLLWVLI